MNNTKSHQNSGTTPLFYTNDSVGGANNTNNRIIKEVEEERE